MSKILIRADGGKNIGLGHIMRTLVLAKELSQYSKVFYICKDNEDYLEGIEKVQNEGFRVYKIKEDNLIDNIKKIQLEIKADLLITDSYSVDENYFNEMKKVFKASGYIDDVNICSLNVDFIINQNINAKGIKYNTNEYTKLFLGTQYSLLRDEFRIEVDRKINKIVSNILVTVGGSDKDYNTLKILNIIKNYNADIHVVIGSAFEKKLIDKIYNKYGRNSRVKLYQNANMSTLMKLSDLAISSSGSTLYELCAMQVPTVGIVVADNQKDICKKFDEMKIIVGTDMLIYEDIDKLSKVIYNLIEDSDLRYKLCVRQKKIVNIKGVETLSKEINNILKSKGD